MYQNYITGQTTLSLNLDFSIPDNHIANVISDFVDSVQMKLSWKQLLILAGQHITQQ
ncbi:hypothetical protein LANSK_19600 [Lactobacillus amylovorus subsp. amylovorus]|jgi:hypothetical protein